MVSGENLLKTSDIQQKRLKTAKKSVSTSFRVPALPESWLKYTTNMDPKFCKWPIFYTISLLFAPIFLELRPIQNFLENVAVKFAEH